MKGAREISALHKSKRHSNWVHHQGSHSGYQELVKRGQMLLSFSVQENKLMYSSASDMMAIKHNTTSANAKNAMKAAAPAPLLVVAVSMKSLQLLGTWHLEDP
jgi:hypothetical protein